LKTNEGKTIPFISLDDIKKREELERSRKEYMDM
jgi:hypothetical protein